MQPTAYTMGNNIKVTNTYSHNYLTGTEALVNGATVHSMGFTWDYGKGNLSNRNNNSTNLQENFTYDAMQRCTTATTTGSATANINTSYDNNGNITAKSDVGDYEYNGSQPHAVTDINNFVAGSFPQADQNITYNKLNKVATITEDINSMEFVYGVASERRKATFKQNTNDVQWTRYYAAAYEITFFTDNHIRDMHYINGPDGLCAIYVRNSKATQDSLYFVFKDHLGSLTTITDKNGSVLQQLNYNLWGKRSVEAGSLYASPLFNRGFTGHEHLDMFGLINMNGRVYDPLLGRFLSPDKYVQGGGSQAFNRYTYCLNNPLNRIDPSGWDFWDSWWVTAFNPENSVLESGTDISFGSSSGGGSAGGSTVGITVWEKALKKINELLELLGLNTESSDNSGLGSVEANNNMNSGTDLGADPPQPVNFKNGLPGTIWSSSYDRRDEGFYQTVNVLPLSQAPINPTTGGIDLVVPTNNGVNIYGQSPTPLRSITQDHINRYIIIQVQRNSGNGIRLEYWGVNYLPD